MNDDEEIQKLLELVSGKPKTVEEARPLNEIERFVMACGIKAGTSRVLNMIIYDLYKTWAKKPMGRKKFGEMFVKLFRQRRVAGVRFYELDRTPFNLTQEHYFKVRNEFRQKYKKRYKVQRQKEREAAKISAKQAEENKEISSSPKETDPPKQT